MSRRGLREKIFKLLFRVEFNAPDEMEEQQQLFLEGEEDTGEEESRYIVEKYQKILEKLEYLDRVLNETAEGWTTKRMGKVDLTILRLAIYELEFDDEIPAGVAINEAVELAKKFGQEESGPFVNGILAKFVRE